MLVKITNVDSELYFTTDSDKNILNTFINNLDELCLTNNSLTFHYGDVDVSIEIVDNGLSCYCSQNSFHPWFSCESLTIGFNYTCIDIFGETDKHTIAHTHIVYDDS